MYLAEAGRSSRRVTQFRLPTLHCLNSLRAMPYQPTPWMMLPFAALLLMIALRPLLFRFTVRRP